MKERKFMLKEVWIFLIALLLIVPIGILTIPTVTAQPLPVSGCIYLHDGASPSAGATVIITDINTAKTLSNVSDINGFYSMTFGIGDTLIGDTLWVQASGTGADIGWEGTNDTIILTTAPITMNVTMDWYYKPNSTGAPHGMPDFPGAVINPLDTAACSVANCFWWFDNSNTNYDALVTTDPLTLVQNLYTLLGPNPLGPLINTTIYTWLVAAGLDSDLSVLYQINSDIFDLFNEIEACSDVILVLQDPFSFDVYYLTCAGFNPNSLTLAVSDPWTDYAQTGGFMGGRSYNALSDHWNPANVSQDWHPVVFGITAPWALVYPLGDLDIIGAVFLKEYFVNEQPTADFIFSPSSPTDLDVIQFTDTSTDSDGTIVSWSWTFGDGGTSTAQNPTHQYADDGTYTVTLTVTDDDGVSDTISKDVIVSNIPPSTDFTYIPTNPTDLDTIQFTDASTDADGTVVAWNWDFGDGGTSTLQNPTHDYIDDGTYLVYLVVADDDGASNSILKDVIVSNIPPIADAEGPYTGELGEIITFDGSGSRDRDGTIVSYMWLFGDGTSGSGVNPTHQYSYYGNYNVVLIVTDDDGAMNEDCTYVRIPNRESPTTILIYPEGGETLKGTVTVQWFIHDTQDQHLVDLDGYLYLVDSSYNKELITRFTQDKDTDEGSYAWSTTALSDGTYRLLLEAVDSNGNLGHDESDPFMIKNYEAPPINNPPNQPSRPSGSTNGKVGVEYTYTTITTDPEGDQIWFLFDWGDTINSGWLGPYNNGDTCTAKHTWAEKDNYNIKVKAKDSYGKESAWSESLPITMPYSYNPMLHFFDLLFQRFPNAFPLLRHLMGY